MPEHARPNGGAPDQALGSSLGSWSWVSEMQAKFHCWAVADPATLVVAFDQVAGNQGARTAGVDGLTVADIEQRLRVLGFLDELRAQIKTGTFRPLPVRERQIPKPGGSGKVRRRLVVELG